MTGRKSNTLNTSQQKVIIAIANGVASGLTSKNILSLLDLSSAGVTKTIVDLMEKDFIEKTEEGYRVIDPRMKHTLIKHYSDRFAQG